MRGDGHRAGHRPPQGPQPAARPGPRQHAPAGTLCGACEPGHCWKCSKELLQEEGGSGTGERVAEPMAQPCRRMLWRQPLLQTVRIRQPFRREARLIRTGRLTPELCSIQQLLPTPAPPGHSLSPRSTRYPRTVPTVPPSARLKARRNWQASRDCWRGAAACRTGRAPCVRHLNHRSLSSMRRDSWAALSVDSPKSFWSGRCRCLVWHCVGSRMDSAGESGIAGLLVMGRRRKEKPASSVQILPKRRKESAGGRDRPAGGPAASASREPGGAQRDIARRAGAAQQVHRRRGREHARAEASDGSEVDRR